MASAEASGQTHLPVFVVDPSGGAMPGAQIIAIGDGTVLAELTAGDRGGVDVPVGAAQAIHLVVSAQGFATVEQDVPPPNRTGTSKPITITLPLANFEDTLV